MKADELYSVINGMECQLNILKNNADKLLNDAYLCGKADQQKETADHLADLDKQVEEVYQKGINNVWEAARKIVCDEGFSVNELYKIFRKGSSDEILRIFTATEALERIKAYEKEKQEHSDTIDESYTIGYKQADDNSKGKDGCEGCEYEDCAEEHNPCHACCNAYINQWTAKPQENDEIKVGDEVRHKSHNTTWTAVVTKREGDVIYLMGRGGAVADYSLSNFEKTGRHFDIESILEEMKG